MGGRVDLAREPDFVRVGLVVVLVFGEIEEGVEVVDSFSLVALKKLCPLESLTGGGGCERRSEEGGVFPPDKSTET